MHAARESTAAPPVPEKAERALLKNMQLLSEKKCCSLANFLWVQSRHQDCCIYKKNSVDKNSICIEAKCHLNKGKLFQLPSMHFFFLSGKFQPCPKFYSIASSTCCGGIFTLFCSFPSLCLSCLKISCCKCQTFFLQNVMQSYTLQWFSFSAFFFFQKQNDVFCLIV